MQLPQEIWTQILKLKDHEETIKELIDKIKTFYDVLDRTNMKTNLPILFTITKIFFQKLTFKQRDFAVGLLNRLNGLCQRFKKNVFSTFAHNF